MFRGFRLVVSVTAALPIDANDGDAVYNFRGSVSTGHFLGQLFRTLNQVLNQQADNQPQLESMLDAETPQSTSESITSHTTSIEPEIGDVSVEPMEIKTSGRTSMPIEHELAETNDEPRKTLSKENFQARSNGIKEKENYKKAPIPDSNEKTCCKLDGVKEMADPISYHDRQTIAKIGTEVPNISDETTTSNSPQALVEHDTISSKKDDILSISCEQKFDRSQEKAGPTSCPNLSQGKLYKIIGNHIEFYDSITYLLSIELPKNKISCIILMLECLR